MIPNDSADKVTNKKGKSKIKNQVFLFMTTLPNSLPICASFIDKVVTQKTFVATV